MTLNTKYNPLFIYVVALFQTEVHTYEFVDDPASQGVYFWLPL